MAIKREGIVCTERDFLKGVSHPSWFQDFLTFTFFTNFPKIWFYFFKRGKFVLSPLLTSTEDFQKFLQSINFNCNLKFQIDFVWWVRAVLYYYSYYYYHYGAENLTLTGYVFHSILFKIKKKSGPFLSLSSIKRKEKKEKDPVKIALTCWISSSSRYVTQQQQKDRARKKITQF